MNTMNRQNQILENMAASPGIIKFTNLKSCTTNTIQG